MDKQWKNLINSEKNYIIKLWLNILNIRNNGMLKRSSSLGWFVVSVVNRLLGVLKLGYVGVVRLKREQKNFLLQVKKVLNMNIWLGINLEKDYCLGTQGNQDQKLEEQITLVGRAV
jgi:hypothetical protein